MMSVRSRGREGLVESKDLLDIILEELGVATVNPELLEAAVLGRIRCLKKQADALAKLQSALKTLREV